MSKGKRVYLPKNLNKYLRKLSLPVFIVILTWFLPPLLTKGIAILFPKPLLESNTKGNIYINIIKWKYNKHIKSGSRFVSSGFPTALLIPDEVLIGFDFYTRNTSGKQIVINGIADLDAKFPSGWKREYLKIKYFIDGVEIPGNKGFVLEPEKLLTVVYEVHYLLPYDDPKQFNYDIENVSQYASPKITFEMPYPNREAADVVPVEKMLLRQTLNEVYVSGLNDMAKKIKEKFDKSKILTVGNYAYIYQSQ